MSDNATRRSSVDRFELGTSDQIRRRSFCPFCRLVLAAIADNTLGTTSSFQATGSQDEYFVEWMLDGRIEETSHRTRRLRLGGPQGFRPAYIVLVEEQNSPISFLGRYVDPRSAALPKLKQWLEACERDHGATCEQPVRKSLGFMGMNAKDRFRLVDVKRYCVVPSSFEKEEKFAALSYIWGGRQPFAITKKTFANAFEQFAILNYRDHISKTVWDAIELVRQLGERYLWVDVLCFIHDDDADKAWNISMMDQIYGRAFLTICAATGNGSHTGLPGLRPQSRVFHQMIEKCAPDTNLMLSYPTETYIEQSKWNARGWTFQERLLSQRAIIFTAGRVFLQCRQTTFCEDIEEGTESGWSIELLNSPSRLGTSNPVRQYVTYVELYTPRRLTYENDILNAFKGVQGVLAGPLGSRFFYGLVERYFDLTLLWEPVAAIEPRFGFPSWSWAGRTGPVRYNTESLSGPLLDLHLWLTRRTWVMWYRRFRSWSTLPTNGQFRSVWSGSSESFLPEAEHSRWQGYPRVQPHDRQFYDPYGRQHNPFYDRSGGGVSSRPPSERPVPPLDPSLTSEEYLKQRMLPYLYFWSQSAHLLLTKKNLGAAWPSKQPRGPLRFGLTDVKGDWCGTVVLDDPRDHDVGLVYECIAISEAKDFSLEEYDSWTYYIPKGREESDWDLYYVLIVETRDDICYRIGIGKVFKSGFDNTFPPGKLWKEFQLG
jgi:Heterokaryon incompatibility protein (HET)